MRVVFSHPSALLAQSARDCLLSRGILSAVVPRTNITATVHAYDVMLCFSRQYNDAKSILDHTDWQSRPAEAPPDDEAPDLSTLDPALAPHCPGCDAPLPLDSSLASCPACAHDIDVAELIARQHGPEALEHCYGEQEATLDAAAVERLTLLCPRCQYSLGGLPRASTCPECGHAYDKDQIVRGFLGR
jgi:hypothetical protein